MGKFSSQKDVSLVSAMMDMLNVHELSQKKIVRTCLVLQTKELSKKGSAVQFAEVSNWQKGKVTRIKCQVLFYLDVLILKVWKLYYFLFQSLTFVPEVTTVIQGRSA